MTTRDKTLDELPYAFDESGSARVVIDGRGAFVQWNDGAQRLLGYRPAEVRGRSATELLTVDCHVSPPDRRRIVGAAHFSCVIVTGGRSRSGRSRIGGSLSSAAAASGSWCPRSSRRPRRKWRTH